MYWFGKINFTSIESASMVSNPGTGEVVDPASLEWEEALKNVLITDRESLPAGSL